MSRTGTELVVRPTPPSGGADTAIVVKGIGLFCFDRMIQAINEAYRVDEVTLIDDKAVALQAYFRQVRNTDAERKVRQIRYRAERRIGQLLKEMELSKGGRPPETGAAKEPVKTLADMGIRKKDSAKWQRLGEIHEEVFESYMTSAAGLADYERIRVAAAAAANIEPWFLKGVERNTPFSKIQEYKQPEGGWWWQRYWREPPRLTSLLEFKVEMRFIDQEDLNEFAKLIGVPKITEKTKVILFKGVYIDRLTGRRRSQFSSDNWDHRRDR